MKLTAFPQSPPGGVLTNRRAMMLASISDRSLYVVVCHNGDGDHFEQLGRVFGDKAVAQQALEWMERDPEMQEMFSVISLHAYFKRVAERLS